jgi:large subunit ribosomal protein L9
MKVILADYVANLGKTGDIVTVSDGYARNYLIPHGFALRASTDNVSRLEHDKRLVSKKLAKEKEEAGTLASSLSGFSCTIERAVGDQNRLYGSVTNMDIEDKLHEAGFGHISRRQIVLEKPIKEVGDYQVEVKIHPEVSASIKVSVVAKAA